MHGSGAALLTLKGTIAGAWATHDMRFPRLHVCNGAPGGDYRPSVGANRTAMEQHPFHFHGHHFWVLGHGTGRWNASAAAAYNLLDPPFRDSYTVFKDSWTAIRFRVRQQLE